MTTIGDVLAIIATLIGLALTSWALVVCCALLFPVKVSHARASAEANVKTNMAVGALMLAPSLAGLAMLAPPNPVIKLLGWMILLSVLFIGAIGAAGLSFLASATIRRMSPTLEEYPAFLRGVGFLVTASMLPILGWFVFGPGVLLASFGGGLRAVFGRTVTAGPTLFDQPVA